MRVFVPPDFPLRRPTGHNTHPSFANSPIAFCSPTERKPCLDDPGSTLPALFRVLFSALTVLALNVHAETVFAQKEQTAAAPRKIDFNRDIRSILSNRCFTCHGPDDAERQADLRLDSRESAIADLGEYAAIVPGKPEASELIKRIASSDPDVVMPPPEKGKPLMKSEVELMTQWIKQGAGYARHWSYELPIRPELPPTSNKDWQRNAIDAFILSRP